MGIRWMMVLVATVPLSCDMINLVDPEAEIDALPEVLSTGTDYSAADLAQTVPDTALLHLFSSSYARRYSPTLKHAIVEYLFTKASELHLNERQLREGLEITGQLDDSVVALPYRVEYAKFESQRAWTFEFACGSDTSYAEYRCYVVSAARMDTLLTLGSF